MSGLLNTKDKLIGQVLIEWCLQKQEENAHIHFKKSLCSGVQKIRFTSDNINAVFPKNEQKSGYTLCYEILNVNENLFITVTLDKRYVVGKQIQKQYEQLITSMDVAVAEGDLITLAAWSVFYEADNLSQIQSGLDRIFDSEISFFEKNLYAWLKDHTRKIKALSYFEQETMSEQGAIEEISVEGAMKNVLTNRYERNSWARDRCLAYYGTACTICGFDFGEVYGPEFTDKIEVHHRKPLNEIKQAYVVNPIEDLIPVCPNCHLVLHSKSDGVYTIEEIKAKLAKE